ncbi:MAG: polysaccharide deacetylase family protein [Candidatus Acidiferrales bacterium]
MTAANHLVILTYHSISAGDSPLNISPALFTEQMEWLASHTSVMALDHVIGQPTDAIDRRTVILTFDDGYADFYSNAAPILLKLKLPAIVFLPTAHVGRTNGWPGQPAWVKEEPLMTWDQVKELADAGIEFGSHTVNHPDLTQLAPTHLERELADSRREIEQRSGRTVAHFCYPYGKWNGAVRDATLRHYRSACTTIAGTLRDMPQRAGSDHGLLPRVDAHYVRNPGLFRTMFTQRFEAYIAARRLIRWARRQPEGGYPS